MGRQKTMWIDEDSWAKLEKMAGDSISGKVRKCIMSHDLAQASLIAALRMQIELKDEQIARLQAKKIRRTME
jgi:hypothetical protein